MKILLLDIETAPNVAHVWGIWQQNIGINQILDSGYVMCWSAKWLGSEEVLFDSIHKSGAVRMLRKIHILLDQADAVIHYNGTRFDIPTLNKEFLLYGMEPPAPYKQIDLLRTARNVFRFPSNKLDYIAKALGFKGKLVNRGHQLWIDCMAGNPEAWAEMEKYNIQDVVLLEEVYNKLKPWIKGHANHSLYTDAVCVCPNCGGNSSHKRGFYYTNNCQYQRFKCNGCGTWFRDTKNIGTKKEGKTVYAG